MLTWKDDLLVNKLKIYRDNFRLFLLNQYLGENEITLNRDKYDKHIVRKGWCNCLHNCAKIQYEYDNYYKWGDDCSYYAYLNNLYHNCKYNPIYEHLYYENGINIISVTGTYQIKKVINGVDYVSNNLYLNNIPVKNLSIYQRKKRGLIHVKFSFDLERYSKMIDYVLASYYRRFKYILFRYLPIEIIKHILYLTSVY